MQDCRSASLTTIPLATSDRTIHRFTTAVWRPSPPMILHIRNGPAEQHLAHSDAMASASEAAADLIRSRSGPGPDENIS